MSNAVRKDLSSSQVAYKKIRLRTQNINEAKKIQTSLGLSEIASQVLAARGFKVDKVLQDYINPTLKDGLPDPVELKNLDKACLLIKEILDAKKPIGICCDFDVDGLSGGAQVYHFLKRVGGEVYPFVPDRFTEGYGLNERIVQSARTLGVKLLITIDFGTTSVKEIEFAKSLCMKTIVVDHHHVGSICAKPDIFVNPQQKGCGFADKTLSASGLAWFLLIGLKKALPQASSIDVREYLDLACLGTICDMVPLTGANRVIAKRGLEFLTSTRRTGLIALKNVIGIKKEVTCHDVGFGIGPRLNAAGRMVHGEVVMELLTTEDSKKAESLAQRLNRLNLERQDTEGEVKERAIQMIEMTSLQSGIVVWDKDFHTGVVGIVAQRLVENFYRPSVVMGIDQDGMYKGSVRGIKGFNVIEALHAISETMHKYGGHEGAGGLTVLPDKLELFVEAFIAECERRLSKIETHPYAEADVEVGADLLDFPLIDEVMNFSPFGMGNPVPIFLTKGLKVLDVKELKGAHLKATLTDGKRYIPAVMWRQTSHPALVVGAKVNIAYRLDRNIFNGFAELQANLQAVEKAS